MSVKLGNTDIKGIYLGNTEIKKAYLGSQLVYEIASGFVPTTSTKAYYKFDDNANDSSGNGNNGTATSISYVSGKIGKCASFNGTTSQISLGNITSGLSGGTEATLNMWIKLNNFPTSEGKNALFGLGTALYQTHYPYTDNNFYIGIFRNVRYELVPLDTSILKQRHLLTITTTPGVNGYKIYQNGILKAQTTGLSQVYISATSYIGYDYYYAANVMDGLIDEVIIENRAWTATEISDYYNMTK